MPVAPGISKRKYGDPTSLSIGDEVKFFVQQHDAERAGNHSDVRLGNKARKLYSWAVRKGLPPPGKKHYGAQTFLHDEGYGGFSGEIKSVYGKGFVQSKLKSKVIILNVDDKGLTFVTREDVPQKYRLQRIDDAKRGWLLINVTKPQLTKTAADKMNILKFLKKAGEIKVKL